MKLFRSLLFLISLVNYSVAQHPVLYGITSEGNGGIFCYDTKDNGIKNVYRFKNNGQFDNGNAMIRGTNEIIYGVANGGPYGYGIIYSLDPVTLQYKILKSFRGVDGAEPISIVQAKDGQLYGSTRLADRGGNSYGGVFFSFDLASSAFKVLPVTGAQTSLGKLTSGSDGLLYGLASNLGSRFIFSYNPETGVFQEETRVPEEITGTYFGAMIEGGDGNLYGIIGDYFNYGAHLFSFSLRDHTMKKILGFASGFGANEKLAIGSDGNLYFATSGDGENSYGTIICFDPVNNTQKVIHHFDGIHGGKGATGVTEGKDGRLYGMTNKGDDINSEGSVFYSIKKDGDDYKILRNFNSSVGFTGTGILVNDKVYGVAPGEISTAGVYSSSYIFSYQSSLDLFQKALNNHPRDFLPQADLLQASDGRFYGLARRGGAFANGGIYSFNPATRTYTSLLPFNQQRGAEPLSGLIQAGNGKLYGLATDRGANYSGVIFSFDPNKSRYVVLRNLLPGQYAEVGLSLGNDGKLYSTFVDGNSPSKTVLFCIDPLKDEYKEVLILPGDIDHPGVFMPASDGLLYSVHEGEILSYNAKDNILKRFPGPTLLTNSFSTKLVEAADHKLYGMIAGNIFSFDPLNGSFSELYRFPNNEITRYYNFTDLVYASDGLFYGAAHRGYEPDATNSGTLYSFDPITKAYKMLREFDQFTGGLPYGQLVELNTTIPPIVSITDKKMFEGETAVLTVSLNRISMEPVTLNYRTVPGTATGNGKYPDFIPVTGQLTIPPGEISTTLSFPLLEDQLLENRETFTVVLEKASEALFQLGDSVGVINIKNGAAPIIPPGGEIVTVAVTDGNPTELLVKDQMVIRASPNPSSDFFTLHIGGKAAERVSVTITNVSGQILDKFEGALKNAELVFGHQYQSGNYFVRIADARQSKVIKLVKASK